MSTELNNLLRKLPAWQSQHGDNSDIIMFSMGRLMRNLPDHRFPGWSTATGRAEVVSALLPKVLSCSGMKSAFHADMQELPLLQRRMLLERHLITPCMAARQDGCHVIISHKQNMSVMLNEEEHLVAHFFRPGFDITDVFSDMKKFDDAMQKKVTFAKDPTHGYLTSLSTEAGDGKQFSIVMHLPALTIADTHEQLVRAAEQVGLGMTPWFHNMQEDTGNLYTVFTNPERTDISRDGLEGLIGFVQELTLREGQMRQRLMETNSIDIADRMGRAFGLLRYSMQLSYQEMLDNLSLLRYAATCGLINWTNPRSKDNFASELVGLNLHLAPAQLASDCSSDTPDEYMRVMRALTVKEILSNTTPTFATPFSQFL